MKLNFEDTYWFAMKAGRRDKAAVKIFEDYGSETFAPYVPSTVVRGGKKVITERQLIPNMFFVRDTFRRVNSLSQQHSFVTYSYRREGDQYRILTIPDEQMERFRRSVEITREDQKYYHPEEVALQRGDKVRIIGGPLDGYEGTLLRAKGRQKRVFVIDFDVLGAIGTHVEPEYIQLL